MIGIELKQPVRDLTLIAARDHGLLINVTRGKTIRLLPPLTIDEREVGMIVRGLDARCRQPHRSNHCCAVSGKGSELAVRKSDS